MRIRKHHVVTAVATLTAVLAVVAVWTYTSVVPRQVGQRFTDNLLRAHGLQLELDAVRGAAHGEILLLHPRISTLGDSSRVVLRADAVRIRPRELRAMFEGRVTLGLLRVERPRIEWSAGMLGVSQPASGAAGARQFPRLKIERFEIVDARLTQPGLGGDGLRADHVDLSGAVDSEPGALRITLESGRAMLPHDSLQVDDVRAVIHATADSIEVRDAHVRTPRSRLDFDATLPWTLRAARGTLRATPVDGADVARFVPRAPRRGRLRGEVRFDWDGRRWALRGRADGRVEPWAIEGAAFDVALFPGGQVAVRHVEGRVNGAQVEGEGQFAPGVWSADARFTDLNLQTLDSLRTASWPAHRLQGRVRLRRDAASDSVRCELDLGPSRIGGVDVDRAQVEGAFGGTGAARGVAVRRALVESPLGRLEFAGHGDAAQMDGVFALRTPAVERVLAWARRPGLRGDVNLTGRVFGPTRAPSIEAESQFGAWHAGPVTAWGGTLSVWGHHLGPLAELEAQLRSDSLRVRGHVWRALSADLAWSDGALQITRSQALAGDSLLALVAVVEPRDSDWAGRRLPSTRLRVETLLARFGDTELRIEDPGEIWWRRGAVYVDSLELVTRGGRLKVGGAVDWAAGFVDARAAAHDVDADLLKHLLRSDWPVQGIASGAIRVQGPLDRVRVDGEWTAVGGRWAEVPVDSVHVRIESDAGGITLRDVRLRSPYGAARGDIRVGALPNLTALSKRGAQPVLRQHWGAASLDATLWVTGVDVARWYARGRMPALPRWGGQVSSTITMAGTVSEPHMRISGAAERVHVGPRDIGAFTFGAEYRDEKLLLHEMRISSGDRSVTANAEVPVRVDFTRGVQWQRDRDVRAHLELPHGSAAVVQRFIPLFEPPPPPLTPGTIAGQLDIDGKLSAPRIHGGFVVDNAAFTLRDLEELYQEAHAVGTFDGTTLKVTELRARTGEQGVVTGSGTVTFRGWKVDTYKYDLDVERVPVYSLPEINAVVNGHLSVEGARVADDRLLVPNINGTLDVLEARITQEFTSGESQLFDTDAPPWLATPGLTLRAEKGKVWMDNSLVEAELAGTLQIVRTRRQLDFKGTVTVKRGKYLDYLHYFNIKGGELDFSANPGFNPKLDIRGETGRPGEKTYVFLTGTAMQPRLQFASDAVAKPEEEIQQEIIGSTEAGSLVSKTSEELLDPALGEARRLFGAVKDVPILRGLSELRGSVDPAGRSLTPKEPGTNPSALSSLNLNVTAGVPLAEDVYLVYQHGLGGDLQQRFGVEWELWRRLVLEGAWEREKITVAGPDRSQNAIDLNLKFRYER